jgi:drug/metabolite transporter (DMT)-like permease
MEILLALAAAVAYGVSDFTGGVLTRRAHVFVVFLLSQLVSSALLLAVVTLWADASSWPGVGWGAAAGLAGVVGTSLLYQGLAIGRMSVVAPITAVLSDPPATRTAAPSRQAIICAFGAGIGFGLFYILLQRSPVDSGLWPLLGTRISLVGLLGLVVTMRRLSVGIPAGMGLSLLGLGVVNTLADLLFLLATRRGLLSLVAVITSMYPAATVALTGLVLGERIASRQAVGLVIAAVSVALIALG